MNRSARKQHHELARKKHKHDQQEHAREAAKRGRSTTAAWILGVGIGLIVVVIAAASLF